jgi:hypothetical protein
MYRVTSARHFDSKRVRALEREPHICNSIRRLFADTKAQSLFAVPSSLPLITEFFFGWLDCHELPVEQKVVGDL